jgi:hypothetical protein
MKVLFLFGILFSMNVDAQQVEKPFFKVGDIVEDIYRGIVTNIDYSHQTAELRIERRSSWAGYGYKPVPVKSNTSLVFDWTNVSLLGQLIR